MTPIFLDTVGLLAVWDQDDQWHSAAVPVYEQIVREGRPTVTTTLVLYESGNAASRSPFRANVNVLRSLLAAEGKLIEPTPDEIEAGWANFVRGLAGSAGIVDHISLVIMRRLNISDAFTNDKHFTAAGFVTMF
jgi:predicted nucleic acid-binding protein